MQLSTGQGVKDKRGIAACKPDMSKITLGERMERREKCEKCEKSWQDELGKGIN